MIIAMLLVGIVGIADGNAQRDSITTLFEGFRNLDFSVFNLTALALWAFMDSPTPDMTFQVYMNAGILVLIASIYAGLWVKYKMKKGLFEPEPIDQALKN
jgi:F0F1-type ATP synthase membrane subunit c/vacuolar-type H+-ATPase subunit K